jgi:translocation and assembly module TamA
LRYDLGFGPLRIDIATPLDRRGGDAQVSVYVSIGQAF